MNDTGLQQVIDQAEIINILNRFVLSMDARDWKAMRSCLTDQVEFNYSLLGASMPPTADGLMEQVRRDQSAFRTVQHMLSNHQVNINDDTAQCVVNFRAQHLLLDNQDQTFWTLVGRYTYSLVRNAAGWRIHACVISPYWSDTDGNLQVFELAHQQSAA